MSVNPIPIQDLKNTRGSSPYFLSWSYILLMATLILLTLVAIWSIFRFADSEAETDIDNWRQRLDLIANSRVAEASDWLNDPLADIEALAVDPSLQLYASEIATAGSIMEAEAQRSYIFSLLSAAADRYGFYEERAVDQVAANVRRPARAGIALFSGNGIPLVASAGMPNLTIDDFPRTLSVNPQSGFIVLGPQLEDRIPLVLFGAPILAGEGVAGDFLNQESSDNSGVANTEAQNPKTAETELKNTSFLEPVGWIVAAKPLGSSFYQTLIQPGALEETAETYVFQRIAGDSIRPITPLRSGGRLLEPRQDQATAKAADMPGGFVTGLNYAGEKVLITTREFAAPVDWVLARSITAEESLAEVYQRRTDLIVTSLGVFVLVVAVLFLVWRLGVSRKLQLANAKEAALSRKNESLSSFLSSIANAQASAMAAISDDLSVAFANTRMAKVTGLSAENLTGRRLDTAFPQTTAQKLQTLMAETKTRGTGQMRLKIFEEGKYSTFQARCVTLNSTQFSLHNVTPTAVLVLEDVSTLVMAQERSETLLGQLVTTLTMIIDARDPWSRFHSARVAEVAEAIALERQMSSLAAETVKIAGQLVNLGKIFVPSEILTKQTPLSDNELKLVQKSLQKGVSLISSLDFKGPVGQTLAQFKANIDGSGHPQGLAGDDIIMEARILSVANAFVAMVSARAHRASLGFDQTSALLQKDAGHKFDRAVVAALINIVENKGGRQLWASYTEVPEHIEDISPHL